MSRKSEDVVLKAMVVDNERWVLADIVNSLPWKKHSFVVAGQTTKPVEAVSIAREVKPDVAFLDIRMPVLSGLDLIPLLREENEEMLFVLVTGHSEFEYAQSALRLGVFDYCLKPLEEKAADDLLLRLRARLERRENKPPPLLPDGDGASCNQFVPVLRYVKEHAFEKLSLEEIAKAHFLNTNYCGYLFKTNTGKTFSQYVRDIRMDAACYLLVRSDLRVGEISLRIGYDNTHYFSRVFFEEKGMSPRAYRHAHKATAG